MRLCFLRHGLACVKLDEPASLQGELLWLMPPRLLAQ